MLAEIKKNEISNKLKLHHSHYLYYLFLVLDTEKTKSRFSLDMEKYRLTDTGCQLPRKV